MFGPRPVLNFASSVAIAPHLLSTPNKRTTGLHPGVPFASCVHAVIAAKSASDCDAASVLTPYAVREPGIHAIVPNAAPVGATLPPTAVAPPMLTAGALPGGAVPPPGVAATRFPALSNVRTNGSPFFQRVPSS